jgi:hypothetical protein
MSALDFAARGLAAQALVPLRLGTFGTLDSPAIPPGIDRVHTIGHAEAGKGAAAYVCDALCDAALLATHPACAFRAADGRVFRLLPHGGAISVEQCGAAGDQAEEHLADDRNAIQAALAYAAATGIGEVRFEQRAYSLRVPQRTSPADASNAHDGHPLVVTASVALRSACGDTRLHFRALDGAPMAGNAQRIRSTASAMEPDTDWRGGGLFVPTDAVLEDLILDHVHLIGGRARAGTAPDPTDHGLWLAGQVSRRITLIGVEIAGFRGDLYAVGATSQAAHVLQDCRFHTADGAALRCDAPGATLTATQCRFGHAGQAAMVGHAANHAYIDCRFHDSQGLVIGGSGPFVRLKTCVLERIPQVRLGSWVSGRIATIDAPLVIGTVGEPQATEIDLDVTAWLAQGADCTAVTIAGPVDLATPVPGADPGTVFGRPARLRIHIASALGLTEEGPAWDAIFSLGGLIDGETVRLSAGECAASRYLRTDGLADLPFIAPPGHFVPAPGAQVHGGSHSAPMPGSTATLDPLATAHSFYPDGPGTVEIALGNAHGHAEGQCLQLWHGGGGAGDRVLRLSPGGAGLDLAGPVELKRAGDRIDLRYHAASGRWRLAGPHFHDGGPIDPERLPTPEWDHVAGKPAFAAVATSGAYGDLAGAPTLGLLAGASLPDPEADRIPFWDESSGEVAWLSLGSGLVISGQVLSANGGGGTGGGGGGGGWNQIAQIAATGSGSLDFTNIPQSYAELLIAFDGVSHNSASSAGLTMALSANGASYASASTIASAGAQSVQWYGAVEIARYTGNGGIAKVGLGNLASSPAQGFASSAIVWRVDGGIAAIRLAVSAGQFDAGAITLYGR